MGRRQLSAGLAAALLGGLAPPRPALAGCKNPGRKCDKNQDCCAHAACKGGKCKCKQGFDDCGNDCVNRDADEKHCVACNRRCAGGETCRCAGGETCRGGACDGGEGGCSPGDDSCLIGGKVTCGGNPVCICVQSTEGITRCGDGRIGNGVCVACDGSADCAPFGEGAFCFKTGSSSNCCAVGPGAGNRCILPCPA